MGANRFIAEDPPEVQAAVLNASLAVYQSYGKFGHYVIISTFDVDKDGFYNHYEWYIREEAPDQEPSPDITKGAE
jgi:hypothetical protein